MNSLNTRLRDQVILHAHYLSRYENHQRNELLKTLNKAHDELIAKIAKTGGQWTKAWLENMLHDIDTLYNQAFSDMTGNLNRSMRELAMSEAGWAADNLDKAIPQFSITTPSPEQLWAAVTTSPADRGHLMSDLMAGYKRSTVDKLQAAVRQGVTEGETLDQMTRRIRGRAVVPSRWIKDPETGERVLRPGVFAGGVMDISRQAAETMAITAVMHVSNVAHGQVYKDNSDLLNGEQWVATLDTATCPECGGLDGKTFDVGDGVTPPVHFRCRCVRVPIVKSWKELGFNIDDIPETTRASMDGQVSASLGYGDWLRSQPAAVQDAALGPGRAALFRDGMSINRFVKDGQTLTLEELKSAS